MNASARRSLVLTASLLLAPPLSQAVAQQAAAQEEPAPAHSALEQLDRAVLGGTWWLGLRYRLESVDQDGFAREAWASTLRTVLGYESAAWHGASVVLEDSFLTLAKKLGDLELQLAWHDFRADTGGADYGTELDASLTWRACKQLVLGLKLADYQADDFATDTTKAWLWLAYAP